MLNKYVIKNIVFFEYLKLIEPNYVYLILKEKAEDVSWDTNESYGLERLLLGLNHPLINLGLAQYGFNDEVVRELYVKSGQAVRLAALMNRAETNLTIECANNSWIREDIINPILTSADENEKYALITNPLIGANTLTSLFERKISLGIKFNELPENSWQNLLIYAGDNLLLRSVYNSRVDNDGLTDFLFSDMFRQAWRLVDIVPVTKEWANTLWRLLRFVRPVYDIKPIVSMERWLPLNENSADIRTVLARLLNQYDLMDLKDEEIKSRILEERKLNESQFVGSDIDDMSDSPTESFSEELLEIKSIHRLVSFSLLILVLILILLAIDCHMKLM
jgi:hypothetical protein